MRRHAVLALLLALPVALSVVAVAQPSSGADPKPASSATSSASAASSSAPSAKGSATPAPASAATPTAAAPTAAAGADAGPSTIVVDPNRPTADKGVDGASFSVKLRALEERVDELKDQIRRSHTRLALLSDTIIGGGAAGSRSEIVYRNEMSSAFRLVRAVVVLDGAVQYNRQDDSGALAEQKEIPVFSGSIPPGDHTVSVLLNFQGNGYGVFTYLRGYKFEVKSSHSFTSVEGKTLTISATSLEKGGVTTPLEQRPAIEWREKVQPLAGGGSTAGSGAGAAK